MALVNYKNSRLQLKRLGFKVLRETELMELANQDPLLMTFSQTKMFQKLKLTVPLMCRLNC